MIFFIIFSCHKDFHCFLLIYLLNKYVKILVCFHREFQFVFLKKINKMKWVIDENNSLQPNFKYTSLMAVELINLDTAVFNFFYIILTIFKTSKTCTSNLLTNSIFLNSHRDPVKKSSKNTLSPNAFYFIPKYNLLMANYSSVSPGDH